MTTTAPKENLQQDLLQAKCTNI